MREFEHQKEYVLNAVEQIEDMPILIKIEKLIGAYEVELKNKQLRDDFKEICSANDIEYDFEFSSVSGEFTQMNTRKTFELFCAMCSRNW